VQPERVGALPASAGEVSAAYAPAGSDDSDHVVLTGEEGCATANHVLPRVRCEFIKGTLTPPMPSPSFLYSLYSIPHAMTDLDVLW
jgi:hypothetical protein